MDYWGLREAAEAFSTRVGGECSFPPLDSQSPNAAVVSFMRDGRSIEVDFLYTVAGVERIDPEADAVTISLPIGDDCGSIEIRILHPIHVLRARIANITVLHREDERTVRRAEAAVVVAREYVSATLEDELASAPHCAPRHACRAFRRLFEALTSHDAFEAWRRFGVDGLSALERPGELDGWPPGFQTYNIVQAVERQREAWKSRRSEIERKAARSAGR